MSIKRKLIESSHAHCSSFYLTYNARAAAAKLSLGSVDTILRDILDKFDSVYGGFGDTPQFPQTDALELGGWQENINDLECLGRQAISQATKNIYAELPNSHGAIFASIFYCSENLNRT